MKPCFAILTLLICVWSCTGQTSQTKQSFWTAAEEKEYKACLPHSLEVWKNRRSAEDYCLLDEEHRRWMRNHPEVAKMIEDKARYQACIAANRERFNNGTREEVRAIYDKCQSEAYGIRP